VNREVKIKSPLGEDVLLFEKMHGQEDLSGGFDYQLSVLSENHAIDLSKLLGKTITLKMELPKKGHRFFNGHVVSVSMEGTTHRHSRYNLALRPWTYLLSLSSTSRIFQNKTVPEIVKKVFRDAKFTDFDGDSLHGTYRTLEYSVQYRESDLNYVNRLMEQEGIYTYFRHENGKHTLVLADSVSAHAATPGYETVPYFAVDEAEEQHEDAIGYWSVGRQIRPAAFSSSDYDFTKPTAKLLTRLKRPIVEGHAYEVYDYPGEYLTSAEGEQHVKVRLDELQANFEVTHAAGTVHGLFAGALFTLDGHPRADQNVEYLVTSATYDIAGNAHDTGEHEDKRFRGSYTCLNSQTQFRRHSRTPRPKVDGPQTATVVGKAGEEIYTDQYGRVKVKFHWDLHADKNEKSSCWVRVSQVWAGAQWGAMHIPRIGQEVIVDFLEGDPDRPIITGRVYNGLQMPPYALPDNMTQSGIKSRSTPGGAPSNFNEIRFEDKKGKEELFIQAEKDQNTRVKHNQSISVEGDRSVSVGGNETISVTGTRSSTITRKETQTFKDAREMTVTLTDTETITGKHTGRYHGGREETVESGDTLTVVGSNKVVTVHGQYNTTADAQFQVMQGPNKLLIKDAVDVDSAGPIHLHNPTSSIELKAGVLTITSATEIVLECGASKISLKSDGTIELAGAQKVKASGAASGLQLDAAGAAMSGTKATVSGTAMTEITGAVVKIN